jgi:uncharacterized RDD family membrane protein YckC
MAETMDKGVRIIVGVILILFGLPFLGMVSWMGGTMGMMGFGMFHFTAYVLSLGSVVLGAYLLYTTLR